MNNQSSSPSSCSSSNSGNTTSGINESSSLPAPSSLRSLRAGIHRSFPNRPPMFTHRSLEALGLSSSSNSSLNPDHPAIRNQRDILNAALAVIHADDDLLAQLVSSSNSRNKKRDLQRGGPPRQ